jgi:hypothetical protein
VQVLLSFLLLCVLAAAAAWSVVIGFRRHRHTVALAREAYRAGLRFSADDLFDLPRRYVGFAAVGAGHSGRAANVTYGHVVGCPVRAFDHSYEVGHGTRREDRRCRAVAVELPHPLPEVLLWHGEDLASAPLAARRCTAAVGPWWSRGEASWAARLAEAAGPLAGDRASLQTLGSVLLVSMPPGGRAGGEGDVLGRVGPLLAALGLTADPPPARGDRAGAAGPPARG